MFGLIAQILNDVNVLYVHFWRSLEFSTHYDVFFFSIIIISLSFQPLFANAKYPLSIMISVADFSDLKLSIK